MINIKDKSGNIRFSTPINNGSKRKFMLMKDDYITLKFSLDVPVYFKLGDYVDEEFGRFELCDLYKPTYNKDTCGYDYDLRLDAYYWKWKNKIFKFTPEASGREASWNLTASLDKQMFVFLRNLKALGYKYGDKEFTCEISGTVENSAKLMTYDNRNMINALSQMAEAWDCEWWVTENFIHFGKCEYGDPVDLELGTNVEEMTRSDSQTTYATRIYAFGSTRNLPTDYRPVDESVVVNGIVQKRLMLPSDTPCIDAYEGMSQEEAIEQVVVFDDVYPRRTGTISDVTTHEYTDKIEEEGKPDVIKKWNAYRFKDSGITFSKDYILSGQELKIIFQSGALNGMEFAVTFNPCDEKGGETSIPEKNEDGSWNPKAQVWEIVRNEDYGRPLPDDVLRPQAEHMDGDILVPADTYILSGFDTKFVSVQMLPDAENELKEKAEKYIARSKVDPSTYTCKMMSDYMFGIHPESGEQDSEYAKHFDVGDRVSLVNKAYFETGRQSRIIGFEYNLDIPYDSPVYTVGETAAYSRLGEIESKVDSLTLAGQVYTGCEENGVYVIGMNDGTPPTSRNVFSALKSLYTFLRKDKADTAQEIITFLKGILIGNYTSGFLGSGAYIGSDGIAEMTGLRLREFLEVPELRFNRIDVISGEQWNTFAFGKIKSVDTENRIAIIDLVDGELLTSHVNDINRGIFHNLTGGNNDQDGLDDCGFQRMSGFSTSYFTPIELLPDGKSFKYALKPGTTIHPCKEMKFAAYGNFTDKSRQSSAYSTRTTEFLLANVNTWQINPDKHYMYIKGKLDGITIGGMELHGYSTLQRNSYLMGAQIQFTPEQLDNMKGNDAYSVNLSTYEGLIVVDGSGNVVDSMQKEHNVVSGENNIVSSDRNVIASRYRLSTRIQAFRGTKELRYNTAMSADSYVVYVYAVGAEYTLIGGVLTITNVTDIANAYVDLEVNCEGMALFTKHYQITAVLDGNSVWSTYHDSEEVPAVPEGDGTSGGWHRTLTSSAVWVSQKNTRLIAEGIWGPPVRLKGIEGDSAFALNLTSDTDAIACDSSGFPLVTGVLASTKAVLYIGGIALTSGVSFSMYGNGCTVKSSSNNTGVVEVTGIDSDNAYVEITALYRTNTVVARYSLVRIKGTAIYQLLPSADVIKRTIDGSSMTLLPVTLICGVTKSDGASVSRITTLPAGYSIKYGTESALKAYTLESSVKVSDYPSGIVFVLFNEKSVMIDKEVIPVVSDGRPSYILDLSNENASVTCDKNGNIVGSIPVSKATVYVGSSEDTGWTFSAKFTGCSGSIAASGAITVTGLSSDNATVEVTASRSGFQTLTAVYTLSKVLPGSDGHPAVVYWLEPSVSVVKKDKNGTLAPSSLTCVKMKQVGGDTPSVTTEKTLKYHLSNGAETNYSGAVPVGSALWIDFILYEGNTVLDRERIPVVVDGTDGKDGKDGINGAAGVNGKDGVSIVFKGNFASHPATPQNGWSYYNTTDKKSYVYQSGAWYQMSVDGVNGINGKNGTDGLSVDYKGELSNPPANPSKNWAYRDTDNGRVYIYNGSAWVLMVADGSNGTDGADGTNGLSVFITYHDSISTPPTPTGNGTAGGWHTAPNANCVWMSQKVAANASSGNWGIPIKIKGENGNNGSDGGQYVQMFKYSENKPTDYPGAYIYDTDAKNTAHNNLSSGWTFAVPPMPVSGFSIEKPNPSDPDWNISEGIYSTFGSTPGMHARMKISFTTSAPGQDVYLWADTSSEVNYDFGYILNPDTDTLPSSSNTVYYASGTYNNSKVVKVTIPNDGSHYIIVGYKKDGSGDAGLDRFQFRVVYQEKLWATTAFCLRSAGAMWEAQGSSPYWSEPVLYSESNIGCNLESSVSQIVLNSIGNLTPSSFIVTSKDPVNGTKTSRYYLTCWKSTNGISWVRDNTVANVSSITITPSASYIMYKVRATTAYPADYNVSFISEMQVSVVKDGLDGSNEAAGSMPRNCFEYQSGKSYVWNKDFRDIVYVYEGSVSVVYMVNVFGKTVSSRPSASNNEWVQGNKETFTAIDTALMEGADIAGFLYKNLRMISRMGTLNGIEKNISELTESDYANFLPYVSLNGNDGTVDLRKVNIYGSLATPFEMYSTNEEFYDGHSLSWYLTGSSLNNGQTTLLLPHTVRYNGMELNIFNATGRTIEFLATVTWGDGPRQVSLPHGLIFRAKAVLNPSHGGVFWQPLVPVKYIGGLITVLSLIS